jgi:ABC-type nitrate/sulfonate/bicarbonate transport system permease component
MAVATRARPSPTPRSTSLAVPVRRRARQRWMRSLGAVVAFFLLWQWLYTAKVLNPLFIASPWSMVTTLVHLMASGQLAPDATASAEEFVLGFGLGVGAGIVLGIIIGWVPFLDDISDALITGFYATPYIAFLPLLVLVAGIGLLSKVLIITWATFFPMLINVVAGVKNTPGDYIRVARSLCIPPRRILTTVVLPSSYPYILAGLRQAVGRGLVGVIVAEFYIANKGIGYFISSTTSNFQPNQAFAAILLVSLVGVLLVTVVGRLERGMAKARGVSH